MQRQKQNPAGETRLDDVDTVRGVLSNCKFNETSLMECAERTH